MDVHLYDELKRVVRLTEESTIWIRQLRTLRGNKSEVRVDDKTAFRIFGDIDVSAILRLRLLKPSLQQDAELGQRIQGEIEKSRATYDTRQLKQLAHQGRTDVSTLNKNTKISQTR